MERLYDSVVAAYIFTAALTFVPSSIIAYLVRERENHVKHMQLISGVSLFSYWLSNFIVDFVKSLIPAIFAIFMMSAYDVDIFIESS